MSRGDGPFKILKRVRDNAYKLQLPQDMAIVATFAVGDLSPYIKDCFEDPPNLRAKPLEEVKDDVEQGTIESSHNPNQD